MWQTRTGSRIGDLILEAEMSYQRSQMRNMVDKRNAGKPVLRLGPSASASVDLPHEADITVIHGAKRRSSWQGLDFP